MNDDYSNDPGLSLTPLGKRVAVILLILGILVALLIVFTGSADAATLAGSRGGCAEIDKWQLLPCVVTDFRPGYVSGTCAAGLWFRNERTARTWRLETPVTVRGCADPSGRVTSAPGWTFRMSK